jgi:integrase/recombinase XerC
MGENTTLVVADREYPVDFAISAWTHAKHSRSQSEETRRKYSATLDDFRRTVRATMAGYDLFTAPTTDLATLAQAWGFSTPTVRTKRKPAPATVALRLACVSSFYLYCRRMGYTKADNPIERVERQKVETYAAAQPLAAETVAQAMAAIETHTTIGRRDKALLAVALSTGRRLSEVAQLLLSDIDDADRRSLVVTFRRAKGGKIMMDRLPTPVSALLCTVIADRQRDGAGDGDPVWISTSGPLEMRGSMLSIRGIERIAAKRLGVSTFHSTRHTFAHAMEDAGAKVSDIQARLGHSNIATTGRYLAALRSAENPFGDRVAAMLGLE